MRTPRFAKNLSISEASDVARWWSQLEPCVRRELRRDPGRPPAGIVARFVEPGEEDDGGEFPQDHYEYVIAHGAYFPDFRPFHICSAHPEARDAVAKGR